jgi:hypothetical protein
MSEHGKQALNADQIRAWKVLAKLVKDEYPGNLSLSEIAARWTSCDEETLAAISRIEALLETADEGGE